MEDRASSCTSDLLLHCSYVLACAGAAGGVEAESASQAAAAIMPPIKTTLPLPQSLYASTVYEVCTTRVEATVMKMVVLLLHWGGERETSQLTRTPRE